MADTSLTTSGLNWESPTMGEDHTGVIIKFLRYARNKYNKRRKIKKQNWSANNCFILYLDLLAFSNMPIKYPSLFKLEVSQSLNFPYIPTQFFQNSSKKINTCERIVVRFLLWVFCMTKLVEKHPIPLRLWHQALGHVGATDVPCSLRMYEACAHGRWLIVVVTSHCFTLPRICVSKAGREGDHI